MTRQPKFVVDTQLFIHALRDDAAKTAFNRFHEHCAPFVHLSVIVAQELRAGIRDDADRRVLEKNVLGIYERSGRSFFPSATAWHRSGDVLARMAKQEGLELSRLSKSFSNDILLALSCREFGCVLITENDRDFRRIRRYVEFAFVKPWP